MIRTTLLVALGSLLALPACKKKEEKNEPAAASKPDKDTAAEPTDKAPEETKTPEAKAPGGTCPDATSLASLVSSKDISPQGPFDVATFTFAKAKWNDDKSSLQVMLANKDWSAKEMTSLPTPIKENGEAIVQMTLYGARKPVVLGSFPNRDHASEEEVPYVGLSLYVKDNAIGQSLGESKVELTGIFEDKVCGTFELNGAHAFEDDRKTAISGAFVATFDPQ